MIAIFFIRILFKVFWIGPKLLKTQNKDQKVRDHSIRMRGDHGLEHLLASFGLNIDEIDT
jgi:hypothetical protein